MPLPAPLDRLQVEFDYPQLRVKTYTKYVLAQGSYEGQGRRRTGWDFSKSSADFYQDPVTYTGMLMPNVQSSAWKTTFTGIYARLRKTDFTITTSALWREETNSGSGDYWLAGDNITATQVLETTADYLINQPFWIGSFAYNSDVQKYVLFECGWGGYGDIDNGVSMRFYSDGTVEVWKTSLLGVHKVSGSQGNQTSGQTFQGVMLIPCRKRELLVVGTAGDGFSHAFTDLDESEDEPTITPAGKFWVKIPYDSATRSAKVQVAKIQFASSATAVSLPLSFAEAPLEDQEGPLGKLYGDLYGQTATPALMDTTGLVAFVADGVQKDCRMRVTMSGDNSRSPFIYAVRGVFYGEDGQCSDEIVDAAPYIVDASLSVGESASSVSFGMTLMNLSTVEGDIPGIHEQCNRPVRVKFKDGPLLLGGRTDPPEAEKGPNPDAVPCHITVRDRWKGLESFVERDVVPFDGDTLEFALQTVTAPVLGGTADAYDLDPEATTFIVPTNSSQTAGEWGTFMECGDRRSQWVDRLMDSFCPDWVYGFRPKIDKTVFYAKSPESLGTTAEVEVYDSWEQAYSVFITEGHDDRDARKLAHSLTVQSFRTKSIEPEATEVRVTGVDRRSGKPVHYYKVDELAEDPATAKADRPDNWLGEKRLYGWVDTMINSGELAQRCVEKLYNRLTVRRRLAQWTCGLLMNADGSILWRGDNVSVVRNGTPEVYRVTALNVDFTKERDVDTMADDAYAGWFWREATYCGELVNPERDAWRGVTSATNIDDIALQSRLRSYIDAVRCSRGSEFLLKMVPETRVLVA